MKGFLAGLILLVAVMFTVLSIKPGGIRNSLRNAARRLRLALILTGVYLAGSTVVRLALPGSTEGEIALVVLGAALTIVFLIVGQDRQPLSDPASRPRTK